MRLFFLGYNGIALLTQPQTPLMRQTASHAHAAATAPPRDSNATKPWDSQRKQQPQAENTGNAHRAPLLRKSEATTQQRIAFKCWKKKTCPEFYTGK